MKRNLLTLIAIALATSALVFAMTVSTRTPRIAYVRSPELVYGYFGMKEAMERFQEQQLQWRSNIDTLASDLRENVTELQKSPLGAKERTIKEEMIARQRNELFAYNEAIGKKSAEEERKALEAVLQQINGFVETYAKEKGFDVVLGTTDAGSLIYGDGAMDITEELLLALNKDHEGLPH